MSRTITRREAAKLLASLAVPGRIGAASKAVASSATYDSIFSLPVSQTFGINADGTPRNDVTFYTAQSERPDELTFDVSNNQISAVIARSGKVLRSYISTGVDFLPLDKMKGGVYSHKRMISMPPWQIEVFIASKPCILPAPSVHLLDNVLPLYSWTLESLRISLLFCAPAERLGDSHPPRALVVLGRVENLSSQSLFCDLRMTSMAAPSGLAPPPTGHTNFIELDPLPRTTLPIGGKRDCAFAAVLEEDGPTLQATIAKLRFTSAFTWVERTLEQRRAIYGQIKCTAEGHAHQEQIIRYAELCRQSAICSRDGNFNGGFLGSDPDARTTNWNRDTYFAMLAMCHFAPDLAARAIPFFFRFGHPSRPVGDSVNRFPGAGGVTQSLANTLAGPALAGAYFRATGDRGFFARHPEILTHTDVLFTEVLASRRSSTHLFPSLFYSDGEARGDFHTGSNVVAWHAFHSMAAVAVEAYSSPTHAERWSTLASLTARAIEDRCVAPGPSGLRFYEGANEDGTFIPGHDGEESDTTLMTYYGLCKVGDTRLQQHAHLAFTPANPLYAEGVDGIWWYNHGLHSATAPAWITALAGSADPDNLERQQQRVARLTDLDGSLWWWPYRFGSTQCSKPVRANGAGKSSWAAAVYLCRELDRSYRLNVEW